MRNIRGVRKLLVACAAAVAASLVIASAASAAATVTVNSTADNVDFDDTAMEGAANDGDCTLREAVQATSLDSRRQRCR